MKKIFAVALLLLSSLAWSQSANGALDSVILAQANAMGKAFLNKDYVAFLGYTHPTVVKMMGGKEKMLADTSDSFNAFANEGVTFLNITFTSPENIYESEGELQAAFTEIIEMRIPTGKLIVYARVVAVSEDKGEHWYFMDVTEHSIEMVRKLLPSLHPDLTLPEYKEPLLLEDPKTGGQ